MREVAQRRQQLEVEHEQAQLSLQEKQEEVRRLQQVGDRLSRGRERWRRGRLMHLSLVIHSPNKHLPNPHYVPGAEGDSGQRPCP